MEHLQLIFHKPEKNLIGKNQETFNILLLHQDRFRKSIALFERTLIPDWIDVVLWGHEHECRIDLDNPTEIETFMDRSHDEGYDQETSIVEPEMKMRSLRIIQPGAPIPTSLSENEAGDKYISKITIKIRSNSDRDDSIDELDKDPCQSLTNQYKIDYEAILLEKVRDFLFMKYNIPPGSNIEKYREEIIPKQVKLLLKDANKTHDRKILLRLRYTTEFDTKTLNRVNFNPSNIWKALSIDDQAKIANPISFMIIRKKAATKKMCFNNVNYLENMSDGEETVNEFETDLREMVQDTAQGSSNMMQEYRQNRIFGLMNLIGKISKKMLCTNKIPMATNPIHFLDKLESNCDDGAVQFEKDLTGRLDNHLEMFLKEFKPILKKKDYLSRTIIEENNQEQESTRTKNDQNDSDESDDPDDFADPIYLESYVLEFLAKNLKKTRLSMKGIMKSRYQDNIAKMDKENKPEANYYNQEEIMERLDNLPKSIREASTYSAIPSTIEKDNTTSMVSATFKNTTKNTTLSKTTTQSRKRAPKSVEVISDSDSENSSLENLDSDNDMTESVIATADIKNLKPKFSSTQIQKKKLTQIQPTNSTTVKSFLQTGNNSQASYLLSPNAPSTNGISDDSTHLLATNYPNESVRRRKTLTQNNNTTLPSKNSLKPERNKNSKKPEVVVLDEDEDSLEKELQELSELDDDDQIEYSSNSKSEKKSTFKQPNLVNPSAGPSDETSTVAFSMIDRGPADNNKRNVVSPSRLRMQRKLAESNEKQRLKEVGQLFTGAANNDLFDPEVHQYKNANKNTRNLINTETSKSSLRQSRRAPARKKARYDENEIYENNSDDEHGNEDKENNFKPPKTTAVQGSYHRTRMSQRLRSRKEDDFDV